MAEHHPPEELLVEYAAGVIDPGQALLVACHLELCPRCREAVGTLEALGGVLLQGRGEAPSGASPQALVPVARATEVPARDLDELVSGIVAAARREVAPPAEEAGGAPLEDPVLPAPLARLVGPLDRLAWRRPAPGLEVFDLRVPGARTITRLTRARPGVRAALHRHRGLELDLVLSGGLHDLTRGLDFERGDVQWAEDELEHRLRIAPGEPCLVLTVNEGPLVPRGPWARVLYGYLGW